MHSLAPASSAFSATVPARCGNSTPKTVMTGSDKHELTCDNGMADSWAIGWDWTTADLPGALTATRRTSPNSNSTP
jgi:hypothetical protein